MFVNRRPIIFAAQEGAKVARTDEVLFLLMFALLLSHWATKVVLRIRALKCFEHICGGFNQGSTLVLWSLTVPMRTLCRSIGICLVLVKEGIFVIILACYPATIFQLKPLFAF